MALTAHEHPLNKLFSSDFEFTIPHYQRPYAWGTEQTMQLLDDLSGAIDRDLGDPYFLGSLVLVKEGEKSPVVDVIDGQQRLTTLTILFAVLRDLATEAPVSQTLSEMIMEPGVSLDNILPKARLALRAKDAAFFKKFIQDPGMFDALFALGEHDLKTDSQRAIRENAKALHEELASWDQVRRNALATLARTRTYLVVVTTPNLASAHRIFSVMNARGLDLEPSDIFKSNLIGQIPESQQDEYAAKWEQVEEDFGRSTFAEFFQHLRAIVSKKRPERELLREFDEQVIRPYLLTEPATSFLDNFVIPYAEAYRHLLLRDFDEDHPVWPAVNLWLARLTRLPNNDWRPAALWALREHGTDPDFLVGFLRKLERLSASILIRRIYDTPRQQRYMKLLQELDDKKLGLSAPSFLLTAEEKADTRERLMGDLYLTASSVKYVLPRLDELMANVPGVIYAKRLTVEHVLPQNPEAESVWLRAFSEDDRSQWTHKLGNLVLLNRTKNSQAQNFEFEKKKLKYFTGKSGSAIFALTTDVLNYETWTPSVIKSRQKALTAKLFTEWELNP